MASKDSREDLAARLGYRYVKIGEGEIPLRDALALVRRNGYDGWLTLEWEKRWHPDIEEPDVVFPHFVKDIGDLLIAQIAVSQSAIRSTSSRKAHGCSP